MTTYPSNSSSEIQSLLIVKNDIGEYELQALIVDINGKLIDITSKDNFCKASFDMDIDYYNGVFACNIKFSHFSNNNTNLDVVTMNLLE